MNQPINLKTGTITVRNSINPVPARRGFLLVVLALASLALSPTARGVTPAPDGGYANDNTAEGTDALKSLTTGTDNTAIGFEALFSNTTGFDNTASGSHALLSNTIGSNNTATGLSALFSNTIGSSNTATGVEALKSNTTGNANTANGFAALSNNTTGSYSTANGYNALFHNTTGISNTAHGFEALFSNTGNYNTADGVEALFRNTSGGDNIALGFNAGSQLTTGSNNIDIGNVGVAGEANTMRIGIEGTQTKTFIAGIRGATTGFADAIAVVIDSSGQLGTVSSSRRFKKEIKPMDQTSQAILGLQPVTFQYKSDSKGTPQFGLIAEEVAKVDPHLVVRDAKGEIYSVRYEAVNAMLLNEFLKEHRKVEEQETTMTQLKATVAKQEATIAKQQKQIEALTTGLQKVSDQLKLSKPAAQIVGNNR